MLENILPQLLRLPVDFRYVAINGTKAPYTDNWQHSRLDLDQFRKAHSTDPRCHAVGVLTGIPSGGILAIDQDGGSCDPLIERLSGLPVEQALPQTIKFSSGRPGRYQALYRVPAEYWSYVDGKKVIKTGAIGEDGKPEQLEFRWNGHQSVLTGKHPHTEGYHWVEDCSPSEVDVSQCPLWILRQIVQLDLLLPRDHSQWTDREWAISYLATIPPREDYDEWLKIGMCLKSADDGLLDVWELWSSLAENHNPGECAKKWDSFKRDGLGLGTLGAIAKEHGWKGKDRETLKPLDNPVADYELKLSRIAALENPIEKDLAICKLYKEYGLSFPRVESHLKYLSGSRQENQQQTIFSLSEFLDSTSQGLEWLIPEMLPKGESIVLAAIPKVGKTLLAVDLAYAVATGGEFLGEPIEQGKVLLVSTDESANSTSIKLTQRGFRTSDDEKVHLMTRLNINDLRALETELKRFRPDLVVIDSLKSICRDADISENSAEFANAIYDLKELLTQYGASGVLIHHETKSKDAEGINKVRGSSAITGATWGIWQLSAKTAKNDEGESVPSGDRILTVTSRDAEGFTTTIKLDPDDFSWVRSLSNDELDNRNNEQKIIDLLKQHSPNGLEKREIDEHLDIGISLSKSLSRLVSKRLITKRPSKTNTRYNVYAYPNHDRDNDRDKRDNTDEQNRDNPNSDRDNDRDKKFYTQKSFSESLSEQGLQNGHTEETKPHPLEGDNCLSRRNNCTSLRDAAIETRIETRETSLNDESPISGEELPEDYVIDLISDVLEMEGNDVSSS